MKKTFWEQIQEKQEKYIQENLNEIAEEIKRKIFDDIEKEGEKMKMSKYKKGDKFIIEIEKVYRDWVKSIDEKEDFFKIKNLSAISLRECDFDKFDKLDETKTYEQGIADAWEMIKKLFDYGTIEIEDIFGANLWVEDILKLYCYDEVKSKIKKYNENQKLIVGDEVEYERDNEKIKGIIIEKYSSDETFYTILGSDGNTHQFIFGDRKDIDFFNLTGRHFPQVEEMLKAMKEK